MARHKTGKKKARKASRKGPTKAQRSASMKHFWRTHKVRQPNAHPKREKGATVAQAEKEIDKMFSDGGKTKMQRSSIAHITPAERKKFGKKMPTPYLAHNFVKLARTVESRAGKKEKPNQIPTKVLATRVVKLGKELRKRGY